MQITMYGLRPFDFSLRKDFELPAWPYTEDPEHYKLFEKYMEELEVFRYDDSDTKVGSRYVMYPLNIKLWDAPKQTPFQAYLNCVYVDENFKPISWPMDHPRSEIMKRKLLKNPVTADLLAWSHWNVPVSVENYTDMMIKRSVQGARLDQSLRLTKCNQEQSRKDTSTLSFSKLNPEDA